MSRNEGKPEDVLNPKKKQLEKITPVCGFIFLVCAFLIWVEKWGSTCQHSCLDIMVGDAATFLTFFFCVDVYWDEEITGGILVYDRSRGGYVSGSSNLIGPNYKLLAMGIDPNYKLNHPLIYVECDH